MRLHTLLVLLVLPSALVVVYLQSLYAQRSDYADIHRSRDALTKARVQDQLQAAAEQAQLQIVAAQGERQLQARVQDQLRAHEDPLDSAATEPVAVVTTATATPAMRFGWHGVQHSGDESADCAPQPAPRDDATRRRLDLLVAPDETFPANCDAETKQMCDVLRRVAINREVMVAVCDSNVKPQLELFLKGTAAAGVKNVLIIALDEPLARFLDGMGVAYWLRQDAAKGAHKISAQKFKFMGELLGAGASVLVTDIDVVYVQDPFRYLHRDSDLEGTTDGWDAATGYGWTEQVDDPPLGWARYAYTHRSTAWNSGLWFVQATRGGQRLLRILAHRMATENTWDQTAYNEEVGLPARGALSGAAITRRAANYLCFANSKTLFRKVLREPRLSDHRVVVSHVNYHANKPAKMQAIYDKYHGGSSAAAAAQLASEPTTLLNTTVLEADAWLQLNGGFVGGRDLGASARWAGASNVLASSCVPNPPQLGMEYPLHLIHQEGGEPGGEPGGELPGCDGSADAAGGGSTAGGGRVVPCALLEALVFRARRAVYLVPVAAHEAEEVAVFLEAAQPSALDAPVLLAPRDAAAAAMLLTMEAAAPPHVHVLAAPLASGSVSASAAAAGAAAAGAAAGAFETAEALLRAGVGVLLLSPRVVLLRATPLSSLHGDADIEVASEGWDDRSAYGYNHVLDDPSMGHTRSCHGLRIAAHDAGLLYAQPTYEAAALMAAVAARLRAGGGGGSGLDATRVLSEELWLPAHNGVRRAGARARVMNVLCFGNSKLFFAAHLHEAYPSHVPAAVHVSYHEKPAAYMRALLARYRRGERGALQPHQP